VTHLTVDLSDAEREALERCAEQRQVPAVALLKDYVGYLLAGGPPVSAPADAGISDAELATLVQGGGAFDWLADEPDLYSLADGEPV
jgi:hypothetical protein